MRERVARALGMLEHAAALTSQEALCFLSQVRLGLEMDILPHPDREALGDLVLLTLPAHLQTMEGTELDTAVRNELRATYVRGMLSRR